MGFVSYTAPDGEQLYRLQLKGVKEPIGNTSTWRISMSSSKISRISFMFPSDPPGAAEFFEHLVAFLGRDPHSVVYEDLILLTPADPPEAVPVTSFELAEIPIPKLVLETDLALDTRVGNFYIHGSEEAVETPAIEIEPSPTTCLYCLWLPWSNASMAPSVSITAGSTSRDHCTARRNGKPC
jgi:hypothetical protein